MKTTRRVYAKVLDILVGMPLMTAPIIWLIYMVTKNKYNDDAVGFLIITCFLSPIFMYHMLPLYTWVKIDDNYIIGKRLWLRTIVKQKIENIVNFENLTNSKGFQGGVNIKFKEGPSINLIRYDMANIDIFINELKDILSANKSL